MGRLRDIAEGIGIPKKADMSKDASAFRVGNQNWSEFGAGAKAIAKADSLNLDLISKPAQKQDREWTTKDEFDKAYWDLAKRVTGGTATPKQEQRLERMQQFLKSKEPVSDEDRYLAELKTTEESLGKTKEDEEGLPVPLYSDPTQKILKKRAVSFQDSLINLDMAKNISRSSGKEVTGAEAGRRFDQAKSEATKILKDWTSGNLQVRQEEMQGMLDQVAQKHGYSDYNQLVDYSKRKKDAYTEQSE